MGDLAALDAHIARLRQLEQLGRDAGPAVARHVERELRGQIARGESPDGKPWKPTRAGTKPLAGAASSLTVRVIGDVVQCRLEGVHARHDLGHVRGGVRRQILPDAGELPPRLEQAITRGVEEQFRKTMEGGRG